MPLIKVEIVKGKTIEYKKKLLDGIHQALVVALKIPVNDRRQRLYELESDHFERTGRSDDYTIIEITMFKGRSKEAKKLLYAEIVKNITTSININGNDITIVINEQPIENWGIRGGLPANEVDLGFSIIV
ncbi:MAG: tautomerase family protein [Bacteroidetes bacterium CG2_30_32_10]|nr:MAG: tautomerase family protein [Bacteroidetes bacterium CG2_30_32_10]